METIKLNFKIICETTVKIASSLYTILTIILTFISWADLGINSISCRISILILIFVLSVTLAIVYICLIKKEVTIWKKGNGTIKVGYDDIMEIAFNKDKKNNKRIVVIPVNTCFDTIVDDDISKFDKPLVSSKTIHGKWIKKFIEQGISIDELDKRINDSLDKQAIKPLFNISEKEKNRGKRKEYEKGTIAIVKENQNIEFFLLALSKFDENNNAQCSKDELIEIVHKLILFYNKNGQGYELFLPLMGTNLSRVGISHEEALSILESSFKLYSDEIHGKINIIIYNKERNKVAICKNK